MSIPIQNQTATSPEGSQHALLLGAAKPTLRQLAKGFPEVELLGVVVQRSDTPAHLVQPLIFGGLVEDVLDRLCDMDVSGDSVRLRVAPGVMRVLTYVDNEVVGYDVALGPE
jgi:hypothetical protein